MANPGPAPGPSLAQPQELISKARLLAEKLRSRDEVLTSLLMKARALEKREETMGEFHSVLTNLNNLTAHASTSRSTVIRDLQEENRILKALRQENDALCEAAQENVTAIEYIMKKYRQHVKKLAAIQRQEALYPQLLSKALANGGTMKDHAQDLEEMIDIAQTAVRVDDDANRTRMDFLRGIEKENMVLRNALDLSQRVMPSASLQTGKEFHINTKS